MRLSLLRSPALLVNLLKLADLLALLAAAVVAYAVYVQGGQLGPYFAAVGVAALIQVNLFSLAGVYEPERLSDLAHQVGRITLAWALLFLCLIALGFLTKTSTIFSRVWLALWVTSGYIGILSGRAVFTRLVRRWTREGLLARTVLVVGTGDILERVGERLRAMRDQGVAVVGTVDLAAFGRPGALDEAAASVELAEVAEAARREHVDHVLIAIPHRHDAHAPLLVAALRQLPADISIVHDLYSLSLHQVSLSRFGDVTAVTVARRPLSETARLLKAIEDRALALFFLLLGAVPMTLIALWIRLDSPGPVLFRQRRYGFNQRIIDVFKFRTMYMQEEPDPSAPQARHGDPRITRVGRVLRRLSLDELPQLYNVLRGEMSLVGPRPHAVPHDDHYRHVIDSYALRQRVKPGITGWAQVNGWRGETDSDEKMRRRVEHDLYYIENWSLAFDLKIVMMTFLAALEGRNAR